ncbi:MAG: SprB repeat-containing protein [Bacteroidetes bacterium]|nr:SprB repeat-containing protein [Bacteroidota bacterium]
MYMVQVTELTIGCVFIDSVEVLNPEPTLLSFTTTSSECVNFCSGSASVQSSGPAPFTYLWQNGATSSFIDSICPGIYEVTVTDSLGCASTGSVEVVAREVLFNTVNASCNNLCNGEAEVILPSGSWQINWNTIPVQNTTVISGLCGGSYSILMVDSSGCILSDSIEILIEQPILSNILTQPVTCLSACDGAVSVSAVGNGPFSFTWNTNPVQLTDSLFQLCEGVYLVTIVDSLGCSKIDTAVVIGPDTLTFSFTSMVNSCTGVCDASAVIFPSAPGGYIYKWFTSPIQYGAAAFGLCPDYTLVEITTSAGCIYFDSVLVIDPNPVFVVMNSDAITCAGDCDGSVGCVALGGNPGYTYEWSIGISSPQVFNLCSGMYTVTVTDASGCTKQNSIELIEPDSIFISFAVTDASCISCSDGSITATVTGGVRDYSYFWNSGSSVDSIISSILPGIYQLCVSDFNSCLYCQSTTVSFLNSVANLGLETINVSLFPNLFRQSCLANFRIISE